MCISVQLQLYYNVFFYLGSGTNGFLPVAASGAPSKHTKIMIHTSRNTHDPMYCLLSLITLDPTVDWKFCYTGLNEVSDAPPPLNTGTILTSDDQKQWRFENNEVSLVSVVCLNPTV